MREYAPEFLDTKVDSMFKFLQEPIPSMDNDKQVLKRINDLSALLALSGEYKSASMYRVDEIIHGEIAKAIDIAMGDKVSASIMNQYVKTAAKQWNYFVMAFDRINSAAGKQLMAIQTLISFEKAKLNIL